MTSEMRQYPQDEARTPGCAGQKKEARWPEEMRGSSPVETRWMGRWRERGALRDGDSGRDLGRWLQRNYLGNGDGMGVLVTVRAAVSTAEQPRPRKGVVWEQPPVLTSGPCHLCQVPGFPCLT